MFQVPTTVDIPTRVPDPKNNGAWMILCRDPQWNYQNTKNEDLYFATGWDCSSCDDKILIVPVTGNELDCDDIHRGAKAPKFVFESKAMKDPNHDSMDMYMKLLICFLCERFVVISRPSAMEQENLLATDGIPEAGIRYWWRYWDNNMNVYQVAMEKFRDDAGTTTYNHDYINLIDASINYKSLREATEIGGMAPGDFSPSGNNNNHMWMRVPASMTATGKESTDLSSFFDYMWSFIHRGTTRIALWDASLQLLSKLVGNEAEKQCNSCANHVEHVLQRCSRCKLVFYCNTGYCQREDWSKHSKICKYFK